MPNIILHTAHSEVIALTQFQSYEEALSQYKSTLRGVALKYKQIRQADLSWAQFQNAVLDNVSFIECDLEEADFSYAAVLYGTLRDCNLRRALFKTMNLAHTTLKGCDLTGTRFLDSVTYKTDFSGAKYWQDTDWALEASRQLGYLLGHLTSAQKSAFLTKLETGVYNGRLDNRLGEQILGFPYARDSAAYFQKIRDVLPAYKPGLYNRAEQLLWQIKPGAKVEDDPFASFVAKLVDQS